MRRVWLILIFALSLTTATALADDASLGRQGETVVPLSHQTIRMAAEEVRLKVSVKQTAVDLTFTFVNEGGAQDVLMGFPLGFPDFMMNRGDPELHDFRTWVDGEEVTVRREPGGEPPEPLTDGRGRLLRYPEWLTWGVHFEAGQSRTVRNTYWASNYHNSVGMVATGYILRSGATWKGPIGEAVIVAEFDGILPGQIGGALPTSYRWEGDRMVWQMRDFEPERDITITVQTLLEQGRFPPDAYINAIHRAERAGGAEGLRILREARQESPNLQEAPDALDLRLAKYEYLYGDGDAARQIARRALDSRISDPTAAYVAYREGWLQPKALLADTALPKPIRRYLLDVGGFEGEPPRLPELRLSSPYQEPRYGHLRLADPDADIDDFGFTVWATPDETAAPIFSTRGFTDYYEDHQAFAVGLSGPWLERETVWYKAWVTDSRGHRSETPLAQLSIGKPPDDPTGDPPDDPPEAPSPEPDPVAKPGAGRGLLWLSLSALALLAAYGVGLALRRGAGSSR